MAGDTILTSASKFCYLGSYLSNTIAMDDDITARIAKGCTAFGGLLNHSHQLWRERGISLKTKVEVYRAVVLTTLLLGSECWTLYRKHIKQLEQFHMCCLRKIAGIRWQDRVSNTRVLEVCGISGIEAFLLQSQFRWVGHMVRMPDFRIPKQAFFGQLAVQHCRVSAAMWSCPTLQRQP